MSFFDQITAQLPFSKKEEQEEYIFALNIGTSEFQAAVWKIAGKHLSVISQFSTPYDDVDELIARANRALDQALGPLEIEPKKILFGVPDVWTSEENLKEEYLKLLRQMLKEFDLEPLAYVTTSHAIAHLLQKKEGVPPTALIIGIGDMVEVALSRGGKIVVNQSAPKGDRLFESIEKVLGSFNEVEVLPSKILLYPTKSGEDVNKIKDELMSYPWMSKLPFLHFPRIEILPEKIAIDALVLAGAVEINPDVDFKHMEVVGETKKKNILKEEETSELGFVAGNIKDKVLAEKEAAGDKKLKRYHADEETAEPVSEESNIAPEEVEDLEDDPLVAEGFSPDEEVYSPVMAPRSDTRMPAERSYMGVSEPMGKKVDALKTSLPFAKISLYLSKFFQSKLIILPIILILFFLAYLFLVKASVTVFVEPKILEKDAEIIADPSVTTADQDKKIIPGSVVDTTETGSDKATATGTKQIGDPARGQVIIYNKTDSEVDLASGAVLSGNGLKFTLDTAVQVASQSSTTTADGVQINWGKSGDVNVTAVAIGPDSNLPAGTQLSVGNLAQSQVVAKVDNALSGGTSKNVTVVTADDQQKLQAQVIDNLKHQAANDLQTKAGDKKLIPEALSVVDGQYSFNKRVGDQATDFSLNATVHFKGTAYSETDLRTIVGKLVETNVPDGYTLSLQDSETDSSIEKVDKDGKLYFLARFKANLLPKLDTDQIKGMIRGQSIAGATGKLQTLNNVVGAEIKPSPNLPSILLKIYRLPLLNRNINVSVAPK